MHLTTLTKPLVCQLMYHLYIRVVAQGLFCALHLNGGVYMFHNSVVVPCSFDKQNEYATQTDVFCKRLFFIMKL